MARSGGKRQAAKQPNIRSPNPVTTANKPPKPFTVAPAKLAEFLETLPKENGFYLTHIDRASSVEKRRLFMGPAILNLVFALLIILRLYYAVPTYLSLLSASFGFESPARVDTANSPKSFLVSVLASRAGLLILDYAFYSLLGKWVIRFLREETSWRISIGFREEEVVVRVSRRWHEPLSAEWTAEDERRISEKILTALDERRLQKSALSLVDASFVLDTQAMVAAHILIASGELSLDDFQRRVFVYYKPLDNWIMWTLSEPAAPPPPPTEQTSNLTKLREILAAQRRENLFFRYIEIVQYEASGSDQYHEKAWKEVKKAFSEQGVDLEQVKQEMGGEKNMPFFGDTP